MSKIATCFIVIGLILINSVFVVMAFQDSWESGLIATGISLLFAGIIIKVIKDYGYI